MGAREPAPRTRVATMEDGDVRHTGRSVRVGAATTARIELRRTDGGVDVLRDGVELPAGAIVDAAVMRRAALEPFLAAQVAAARTEDLLLSIHLKATMMKVSDPILFGYAIRAVLGPALDAHADALAACGADPDQGLGAMLTAVGTLPEPTRTEVRSALDDGLAAGPRLAMVDSDRGITNLHVPSDVIIDASMPAMIRESGRMWGPDGELHDTLAVIPDSSYAALYRATVEDCRAHGAFDPTTMGTVPNVGLMAQAAEEYGSHDTTFRIAAPGTVAVVAADGTELLSHDVAEGDVWRLCRTREAAVRDWVRLAVDRARLSGMPVVFWLDADRAHDAEVIALLEDELAALDTAGLDLRTLPVEAAARHTLTRARAGEDTIAATGNVLRDYLTDLFPILELGTSAKMLSIVPLMAGGAMFETGAGGSAPKHVQQLEREGHLRWDSLGEFMAMVASAASRAVLRGANRAARSASSACRASSRAQNTASEACEPRVSSSPTRRDGERPSVSTASTARSRAAASTAARGRSAVRATCSSDTTMAMNSPSESQRRWPSRSSCWTCLGAEPPAPVSNIAPPAIRGTIESILALVPSSRIGNRSVR